MGAVRFENSTEQPRAKKSLGLVRCLLEWLNNSGNSSDVKVIDRLFFLFAYARACVCVEGKNICRIRKCTYSDAAGALLCEGDRVLFSRQLPRVRL